MAKNTPLRDLRSFAEAWALRLGLGSAEDGGWKLVIRWATKTDIDEGVAGDDYAGTCTWQVEHRTAVIRLNKSYAQRPAELHHTIVHELLHVRFEGHLSQPRKYDPHYEHAINYLAKLLLELETPKL